MREIDHDLTWFDDVNLRSLAFPRGGAKALLEKAELKAKTISASRPLLFFFIRTVLEKKLLFRAKFDLLLEGFPRSGNSYMEVALTRLRPGIKILSHGHHPAFVFSALRRRKPVCLLVRDPTATIASWIIYKRCSFETSIEWYTRYHKTLVPLRSEIQVIAFQDIIDALPEVVHQLNCRFDLGFKHPPAGSQFSDDVIEEVRRRSPDERKMSVPNAKRRVIEERIIGLLGDTRFAEKVSEAHRIFRMLSCAARVKDYNDI